MGSLAFPARGSTIPATGPHPSANPRAAGRSSGAAAAADSETRRILGLLVRTLDRLPE